MKHYSHFLKRTSNFEVFKFLTASLIWRENRSKSLQYLIEVLSNLQLIAIILNSPSLFNISFSESHTTSIFRNVVQSISLIGILPLAEGYFVTILFAFMCVYFFLVSCLSVYICIKYFQKQSLSSFSHSLLTYWAQLHHTLIFWILNLILMSICTNNPLTKIIAFGKSEKSILIEIFSIFLIIVNIVFALLAALFCYDPFMTNNPFASYNSKFQRLTFLHKAIISPILIFVINPEIVKWCTVLVNLILAFIRQEIIYYYVPYYKHSAMKIASLLASSAFCLTFLHFIAAILDEFDQLTSSDIIFLEVAVTLLFLKISDSRLNYIIRKYISIPEAKLSSQKDIFKRIFVLTDLRRGTNLILSSDLNRLCNQHTLYLMGKLSTHNNNCNRETCICQYMLGENQRDPQHGGLLGIHKVSDQLQIQIILDILSKAIKGFRNNNMFKIMYAHMLLKYRRTLNQAFFTIFNIGTKFRTFNENILIFHLKKQLEEEIISPSHISLDQRQENKEENSFNIKQVIDIEKRADTLFVLIEKNTQAYIELWGYYLKNNIHLQQFTVKSKLIESNAQNIEDMWNKISQVPNVNGYMSPYIYTLYCTYLTLVRNTPSQAEKIFLKHYSRQKKYTNQVDDILTDLNLDDNCDVIFYISMAKDTLGRVLHASRNIYEELGWSQLEVLDRNIKTIQPSFIKDRHDQILLNHIDGVNKESIGSNFEGLMYDKKGYSVPIKGYFNIFPYVESQPIYAGIIRRKEITHEYLILASNGIVEAYSKEILKDLDISPNQTVHISQICKNFEQVKSKLDPSFQTIKKQTISSGRTRNDQVTMVFCSLVSPSNQSKKEISYTVKANSIKILDQSFVYLHLYNKRKYENLIEESFEKLDRIELGTENTARGLLDLIPEEFVAPYKKEDSAKKYNNALFNLSSIVKKNIYSKITSRSLTKNITDFAETQINTDRGKSTRNFNNSISELLAPKESSRATKSAYKNKIDVGVDAISRSLSVKSPNSAQNKLEQAVYIVPRERYMRILDYLISFFAVICFGLICFHAINSHYKFDNNLQKIELIVMSQRRSLALSNVDTYVRLLDFITKGVLSDKRHISAGTLSWRVYIQGSILQNVNLLHQYNNNLFNSLYILDQSAQAQIYQNQVRVKRLDTVQTDQEVDAFRVLTDIANTGLKISQMDPAIVSTTIPEVKFVLDNALNGPLLASEQIINVIIEDCKQDLYEIRQTDFLLLIVTMGFGVFILLLLFLDIKKFLAKRNLLIEILFRMNDEMVQNHLKIVSKFHRCLSSSMFNPKNFIELKSKLPKISDSRSVQKKNQNINKKGINSKIIQGLIFTGATVIVFASFFIVIALQFQINLDRFLWKIDKMVQVCSFRINLNLLHLGVLEYIGENNSTMIRDRPVEEEMNYYFEQARLIPDIVNKILLDTTGVNGTLLKTLFEGNLCTVIKIPIYPDFFCNYIGDIVGAKGMVRIASFLVQGYEESKRMYDESNHTLEDAFIAAGTKNKILGEQIAPYTIKTSEVIEELFKEDLRQSVLSYEEDTILIIVAYISIYTLLAFIFSFRVWKNMKKERGSWRKIIRQIPFSIVVSNKLLKTFLVNNCDHMLDSFKNSI